MMMVFPSTLRSLCMLQASKLSIFCGPQATSFHQDLKIIVESKVGDFERALAYEKAQARTV